MHPAQHPRPRPPAQRAPSSRLTALPTPLSPRRQRPSALSHSTSSSIDHASPSLPSPIWSSSIPPDTPPLGSEELGKQLNEKSVVGGDNKVDQDERESSRNNTPASTVPFPSTSGSIRVSRDSSQKEEEEELGEVATPTHSQSFNCILDDGTSRPTVAANTESAGLVKDPKMLGQMSREELEKMLNDADRIIREKEQELSVFTTAGEGLLQEYHSLRNRHETLLSRQRSVSGTTSSPLRPSRLSSVGLSPSQARVPSESGSMRGWRNSLGPSSAGTSHHRRISSGRVGISSSTSYVFASSSSSISLAGTLKTTPPQSIRIETSGGPSPSTSPTALRSHRFTSSTSVASLFAPPPRTSAMSPKASTSGGVDIQEVEHLSHLNYSLTQRVEELEAESEFAEREGRKKLKRLEKELLALKEDLERSEGRNAALEMEMEKEGEKKEEGTSRNHEESQITSESEEEEEEDNETFTLDRESIDDIDSRNNHDSTSPSASRFLSAPSLLHFRAPGNGVSRLRAVSSTSSLASLPRIPLFDPSILDAQQDELLNQLIAKIDELQDANEAILEEREDMEEKLEIAREEVREWMGKCEDLEEQRNIEWEGNDRKAIGWLDDSPSSADRRSRKARQPESREGSPTPPSSARAELGRSLRNELSGLWSHDTSTSQDPDTIQVTDDEEEEAETDAHRTTLDSIVVHSDVASSPVMSKLNVPRIRRRNPRRTITPISFSQQSKSTADDLVPTGTLGATTLDSKNYEDFSKRAEQLEPVWADEGEPTRSRLEGATFDKQKLIEPPTLPVDSVEDTRKLRGKKEKTARKASRKNKNLVLSSIRFGSDEEDDLSTPVARRTLALRRLGIEASSRHTSRMFTPQPKEEQSFSDDDDATSVVSSNYDLLDAQDRLSSNDYYPVTLRARYHPRMLTNMMRDSAVRHVVTLITWIRFLVVLAMALSFAVWQGPRKTLGLVDGRRRLN